MGFLRNLKVGESSTFMVTCPTSLWRFFFLPIRTSQAQLGYSPLFYLPLSYQSVTSPSLYYKVTEREMLTKASVCMRPHQCVYRRKITAGSYMSIGKPPAKNDTDSHPLGSQTPCYGCRTEMCSNMEQERIQKAALSRLLLAGCDSQAGPLSPVQFAHTWQEAVKTKGSC